VNKSTVPVGTGDWVAEIVRTRLNDELQFSVVSNPEFLREGSAIQDFLNPDRIVIGSLDRRAAEEVAQLYLPLRAPIVITDLRTAEMIKYASNAFLATRISFINEIADICEAVGADVKEVAAGMGYDRRIGHHFLDAGLGWGGSCFPKDVKALARLALSHGCNPRILKAAIHVNEERRARLVGKLKDVLGELKGTTIGLMGLAFKPNTDDIREAPSIYLAEMLLEEGARVKGYDPEAMDNARKLLPQVEMARDPYDLAGGCDALVVVTDWNEFKQLDLFKIRELMRRSVIVDGRNIYEPGVMREMGFIYHGMGRGTA
ncbi:MAG TPA: UDP-glucose/GDP-mannose dehydrogenase family protein, partial [Candidatus Latescibacteria bacterium]|nr:UDP-glucose/GDP-mannose dehydrogenase family protein [Candidatus Latescibacterota bacterium]